MPKYDLMEHCPLQILSFENVRQIVAEEVNTFPGEWHTKVARREWRKVAFLAQDALLDAFRRGAAARDKWLTRLADEFKRIEQRHRSDVVDEIYQTYVELLDRIHGSIYRHILRHAPTAVFSSTGHLYLSRLVIYRNARLRDAEKPALQELMELVYDGSGLKIEAEFSWQPLSDGTGQEAGWRRRVGE